MEDNKKILNAGEVLKNSFSIYGGNFDLFIKISVISTILCAFSDLVLPNLLGRIFVQDTVLKLIPAIFIFMVDAFFTLFYCKIALSCYFKNAPVLPEGVKYSFGNMMQFLGIYALLLLLIFPFGILVGICATLKVNVLLKTLLIVLVSIPAMLIFLDYSMYAPVFVAEGKRGAFVFARSKELAKNHKRQIFFVYLFSFLILAVRLSAIFLFPRWIKTEYVRSTINYLLILFLEPFLNIMIMVLGLKIYEVNGVDLVNKGDKAISQ